jgi:vacuolar-type H+-ATPase subunit I/STV1
MSSTGGISTTNSPSISDQVVSASAQNQQVLSMSSDVDTSSGSVTINMMPDLDGTPQVAMVDVQVQDMQGEIDTAISGVMTASEADQIADQIVAQNIQEQQEQAETEQQETGQYSDESTLVAYLGYVVGFDAYRQVQIPQQETWYESRVIYASASIDDNTQAFYGLATSSLNKMGDMINMQPPL